MDMNEQRSDSTPTALPDAAYAWERATITNDPSIIRIRASATTNERNAHKREVASFVASREASREDRFKRHVSTLLPRASFTTWAGIVESGMPFEHPATIGAWRAARSQEGILERLRRCASNVHKLTTASSGIALLADGSTLTLDERDNDRERHNAVERLVEARREARRYYRCKLRSTYWGTLTTDGMSLSARNARNVLAPLTTALALSDTLITRDGITTLHAARGVVRHDATGDVSPWDTHAMALLRQNGR